MFVLVAERPGEGALKLGEKAVLGAGGFRTMEVFFAVKKVDVLPREPDLQEGLDGRLRTLRVDDGTHHTIGGIRHEIVWFVHVGSHNPPIGGGSYTIAPAGREAE